MNRRDALKTIGLGSAGLMLTTRHAGCSKRAAPPSREPALLPDRAWALGPFVKHRTPVLTPNPESTFFCPVSNRQVHWEEQNVYNPTAVVRNGQVFLLYRADDAVAHGVWDRTCRTGLASSDDGIRFTRRPEPVLFPDNDAYKEREWVGGIEDIHVIEEAGTYYVNYTAWNGATDSIGVATSHDLVAWTKHGPAFGEATDDPAFHDRTGVVISRLESGRLAPVRIDGRYWMYYGLQSYVATSNNLIDWSPLVDDDGKAVQALHTRAGRFDSGACEAGAVALLTGDGIVLLYNALNVSPDEGGDPSAPAGWSGLGQALLDPTDPTRLLDRLDQPFLRAELEWELSGFISSAVVSNALVFFRNEWLLYYGAADRRIGMARFKPGP